MYGVKALSNDFSTELRIDPKEQYPRVIAPLHLTVVDFMIFANVAYCSYQAIPYPLPWIKNLLLVAYFTNYLSSNICFEKKKISEELSLRLSMGGLILYNFCTLCSHPGTLIQLR